MGVDVTRSVGDLVATATETLAAAGIAAPGVDAERLALVVTGSDRAALVRYWRDEPPWPRFAERFAILVGRRAERVPLQHIEGTAAFRDFEVAVGAGVFVPRPETETTVEVALECATPGGRLLDAGTGSGVIAIAMARELEGAEVHATERSMAAIVWAARNIGMLAPRVVLHEQWFLGLDGDFDLIVSNPPYVDTTELAGLEPEVRDHDPEVALVPAGGDALADIALLVRETPARLRPGGTFVCEIGAGQGAAAAALARAHWRKVEVGVDLAGRDRVLVCREPRP